MKLVGWIAAACSTVKWAVLDTLWRWEFRKTGLLPVTTTGVHVYDSNHTPEPVEWTGATMNWATELRETVSDMSITRSQELVRVNGRLNWLADTDEYPLVHVSIDKLPAALRAADAPPRVSLVRTTPRSGRRRDALGVWDPSTADWSAPASIFEATVHDSWRGWTGTILSEDRPAIALSIANQVLCGAVPLGA